MLSAFFSAIPFFPGLLLAQSGLVVQQEKQDEGKEEKKTKTKEAGGS